MGRNLSLNQKLLRIIVACVLVIAVGGAGIFGAVKLLGGKGEEPTPKQEALDGLSDGQQEPEPKDEDDLTVKLSRAEADAKYGALKSKFVLQSSFLNMGKIRSKMTGFEDAVSIPFSAEQEWIDTQRRSAMTEEMLNRVLSDKLKEWDAAFSQLQGDALEVAVRDRVKNEIMRSPIFADMVGQALLTYPQVKAQNPWLVQFIADMDESYARAKDNIPDDQQLVGLEAWIHFESKEAKDANDLSKLVINDRADEKVGAYDFFYPAAQLAELFDQFFAFEGEKAEMSSNNWHLTLNADHATQRTSESDYQENRSAYIFVHRTKMGKDSVRIGFNTTDRRIELFKEAPKQKDTPPPAQPTPDPGDGKVKLTVNYQYQDGTKAAESFVGYYPKGSYYSVASPTANKAGFVPDRATVTGGPISKDTVETVTYYGQGETLHNATINYLYRESGQAAAAPYSKAMRDGETLTRKSPEIGGYTADKPEVTVVMRGSDIAVNVYYDKNAKEDPTYTLAVLYQFTDGSAAAATHTERHKAGESYSVTSPSVANATPDRKVVSGVMPNNDRTEIVTYIRNGTKTYPLTLECVDGKTGFILKTVPQGQFAEGASFTAYAVAIDGYTADQASVSGIMPGKAHTVRITYTRKTDGNGDKDRDTDPDTAPGFDPGIGDNKPEDSGGNNESDPPAVNDPDPNPPSTPSMPEDNRNDEGQDPNKPITNPITPGADNAPAQDIVIGGGGDASDSQNGKIDLDDSVTTKPRSEYNPPSGAQQTAPIPREKERVSYPPVEPPAPTVPATVSEPATQQLDESASGGYEEEPELSPLSDAVDAFAPAEASYSAAEPAAYSVEKSAPAETEADYNAGGGITIGTSDYEEMP